MELELELELELEELEELLELPSPDELEELLDDEPLLDDELLEDELLELDDEELDDEELPGPLLLLLELEELLEEELLELLSGPLLEDDWAALEDERPLELDELLAELLLEDDEPLDDGQGGHDSRSGQQQPNRSPRSQGPRVT